ncbi:DUF1800 domain-containing protein [bacterium]|nr:MAG: DUF1800 domain-containing protein [bacterium]
MALRTDREKTAHLLRRFGLGASEAELDYYGKDGYVKAVDLLLSPPADDGFDIDPSDIRSDLGKRLDLQTLTYWWAARLMATKAPLRERMTLFWHDHFATSADKVKNPQMMLAQNEILRKKGLGKFRDLLGDVSKDPAMLFWLDNQENVKGKPNENFAREVMELFTLGVGNYSETDVREAARAFTGWTVRRQKSDDLDKVKVTFWDRANLHDDGQKTVLGKSGALTGDDVLDVLCANPRSGEYLVEKIWDWFVYPGASPETLKPFIAKFRESGLDVSTLLRAIMLSPEFVSDKAERSIVKGPADVCIVTMRQMGIGALIDEKLDSTGGTGKLARAAMTPAAAATITMKDMGMWIMYPPDVDGWKNGANWISTATMVARIAWSDRIFGQTAKVRFPIRYPAKAVLGKAQTPEEIVDRLISVFDAPIKPERKVVLIEAATKAGTKNLAETAAAVSRLIFAAPEFQFC